VRTNLSAFVPAAKPAGCVALPPRAPVLSCRVVSDAETPAATPERQAWLEAFVSQCGGIAGTVHLVSSTSPGELALAAAVRIPESVKQVVARVPRGKGMAGLALERDEPISTCNIKTDATGQVRPGARMVDARAGVALPVHDASGKVRAVVGVAFTEEKALSESELADLARAAHTLP
jgi:L-methionine (R)-S-oxide reductase